MLRFLIAAAILGLTGATDAQTYPTKPVRFVVGFAAGGAADLPARLIADRLSDALGQRVIVENRTGAGGQIATQDVLSKPRDGYNLLLCTHFEPINLAIRKDAQYKLTDLAPISQISRYYYAVALTNDVPATTWNQFVAYAKANPGKINYGSVGRGSAGEVAALEIGKLTGTKLTGVQYKGGAEVTNDLMVGRIHIYVAPTLTTLPLQRAGKIRVVAITSPERLTVAPDIPTLVESGLNMVRFGWLGICAGAGTPQPIIATLNRHVTAIVKSRDYREMIEKAGSIPIASTPEELGTILSNEYEQTVAIAREFGLQVE